MNMSGDPIPTDGVDAEALDWALRMTDPEADWDAFTVWLEGDPANSERYDAAAMALEEVTVAVEQQPAPTVKVANDIEPSEVTYAPHPATRRFWLSGGVAAALVAVLGLNSWTNRDQTYMVATNPGEQRTVELADGSSIVLAGGSRVQLDPTRPRSAAVESGEALFVVQHDDQSPFLVTVGDLKLVDLGTVFSVRRVGARMRVAVAEGAVMVDREGLSLRLDPGQAAVFEGAVVRRERQDVAEIGGWRNGLLSFDEATIEDVAEELSRNLGLAITAAPEVKRRPFSGTLEMTGLRNNPTQLGALLDVRVRRDRDAWVLEKAR